MFYISLSYINLKCITMYFFKKDLKKLTLDLGQDCVHIYLDYKDQQEPIHIAYWLQDEWEEDAEVAHAIFRAIQLFYTDKQLLMESLGHSFVSGKKKPYAISTSDGHDEDWTYYDSELEASETFIYMQGYETDIHLYEFSQEAGYEVIDSWCVNDDDYQTFNEAPYGDD